ncbi:MAG: DUF4416 family protein [bacterium]
MTRRIAQVVAASPPPAKLFMGLILSQHSSLDEVAAGLADRFGPIEAESPVHPFDHTGYYCEEMGPCLKRKFVCFHSLVPADHLADIKCRTNEMEALMGEMRGERLLRRVNVDPGILTLSNVVLATTKNHAHRIYLSQGIFAEVTLIYARRAGWQPLDWTYPDYRAPLALDFFSMARERYHRQIRDLAVTDGSGDLDKQQDRD